jgi:formyltetrahydrofolate deformylase
MENRQPQSATLLIYCEDRSGIIAAVTDFIHAHEGNIIYLDQYVDAEEKIFFMRIEWDLQTFVISPDKIETLFKEGLAKKYKMNYRLSFSDEK